MVKPQKQCGFCARMRARMKKVIFRPKVVKEKKR